MYGLSNSSQTSRGSTALICILVLLFFRPITRLRVCGRVLFYTVSLCGSVCRCVGLFACPKSFFAVTSPQIVRFASTEDQNDSQRFVDRPVTLHFESRNVRDQVTKNVEILAKITPQFVEFISTKHQNVPQ